MREKEILKRRRVKKAKDNLLVVLDTQDDVERSCVVTVGIEDFAVTALLEVLHLEWKRISLSRNLMFFLSLMNKHTHACASSTLLRCNGSAPIILSSNES